MLVYPYILIPTANRHGRVNFWYLSFLGSLCCTEYMYLGLPSNTMTPLPVFEDSPIQYNIGTIANCLQESIILYMLIFCPFLSILLTSLKKII